MTSKYEALRAEVLGSSISFDYDGQTYELDGVWNHEVLDLVLSGKKIASVRSLLGDEQWRKFRKKHGKEEHLDEIMEASLLACGITKDSFYGLCYVFLDDKLFSLFEVDLLRSNINLSDFFAENLSFRTLCTLFETLPIQSATMIEYIGPEAEWSRTEYFMADLIEMTNNILQMSHVNAQVNGLKKTIKAPGPIYVRPGQKRLEEKVDAKPKFNKTSDLKALINPGRKISVAHRSEGHDIGNLNISEEDRGDVRQSGGPEPAA